MKIKQVMAKTGLTDRAIRLYIENELVKPECDESYNGRKSIEFSETDVENLKNIALLRKADFSIQEIKSLQMGVETAQNTIKEYINRTNEKIQFSSEIIEKIGTLADEENVTAEMICKRLSNSMEDAQIPKEDMEPSIETQLKMFFRNSTYALFEGLIFNSLFYFLYCIITQIIYSDYETKRYVGGCLVFLMVVYTARLCISFALGRFILEKIGNGLINFISIILFKVVEVGFVSIMSYSSHTMRAFVDFSWETVMFILRYGFDLALRINDDYYNLCYVTCFVPIVVMFIGLLTQKKKVK